MPAGTVQLHPHHAPGGGTRIKQRVAGRRRQPEPRFRTQHVTDAAQRVPAAFVPLAELRAEPLALLPAQPAGGLNAALRQGAPERLRPLLDSRLPGGLPAETLQPERQAGAAKFRQLRLPATERFQRRGRHLHAARAGQRHRQQNPPPFPVRNGSDARNHAVKRTVARPGRQARAAGAVRHHARRKEIERAGEHNPAALRIVQRDGTAGKGVFAGRDGVQQLSDAVSSHGFFICSQAAGRRSRPSPAVLHGFRSPRPLRVRAPRSGRHPGSC